MKTLFKAKFGDLVSGVKALFKAKFGNNACEDLDDDSIKRLGVPGRRAAAWPDQFGAAPSAKQLESHLSDVEALFNTSFGKCPQGLRQ